MKVSKIFIHDLRVDDILKCKKGFKRTGDMSDSTYGGYGYYESLEGTVTDITPGAPSYPEKGRIIWFNSRGVYEIALERVDTGSIYEVY